MTNDNVLTQYQSEALEALKSVANLGKPFEKVIMDALKLFMAIPGRINFLQMGRYGQFSEQTYRNTFTRDDFDWFNFNLFLANKVCTGAFRAIAVDPSYIPKAGNKTPWFGRFWSGAAAAAKRGLELMGMGLIDVDNHECMTLSAFQTPNAKTLEEMDYNLVDWYRELLISMKDKLLPITKWLVADAFFSKKTFILPLLEEGFHVVSRLRNDAVLWYPTVEKPTGKRGHPRWYDGKIDFANLDPTRCVELHVDKGRLFGLKAYSRSLKRFIKVAIWYPDENATDKWQIYFSTDQDMTTKDVINCYRTRFQLEFCFRDAKSHAGLNNCQARDLRRLEFHFNTSFASINLAKVACKDLGIPFSVSSCKSIIHNAYMLERFICVSGLRPDPHVIDKLFKELVLFTSRAA